MKTWEMIKELTENPEKEFISCKLGGGKDDVLKTKSIDGAIRFCDVGAGRHEVLIGVDLKREWEEVKEPVDKEPVDKETSLEDYSSVELLQELRRRETEQIQRANRTRRRN